MKKKKIYIRPDVEIIITKVEQQLLAGTPAGGHGGGGSTGSGGGSNPGKTPDEPSSAKPVGSVGSGWYEEENDDPSGTSYHSLWN